MILLFKRIPRKHLAVHYFYMILLFENLCDLGRELDYYLWYKPAFMPDKTSSLLKLKCFLHYDIRLKIFNIRLFWNELNLCFEWLVETFLILFLWKSFYDKITIYPFPFFINYVLHDSAILLFQSNIIKGTPNYLIKAT